MMKAISISEEMNVKIKEERLNLSKFVRQAFEAYKNGKWTYDNLKE